jgi:hypothetical protein
MLVKEYMKMNIFGLMLKRLLQAVATKNTQTEENKMTNEINIKINADEITQHLTALDKDRIVETIKQDNYAILTEWIENADVDLSKDISSYLDEYGDDFIENWVDSNLDISDKVENALRYDISISDYFDLDEVLDFEDRIQNLAGQYRPGNGCGTGNAITDVIATALKYIIHNNENDVKQTIGWVVRDIVKDTIHNEIETVLRPLIQAQVQTQVHAMIAEMFAPAIKSISINTDNPYRSAKTDTGLAS